MRRALWTLASGIVYAACNTGTVPTTPTTPQAPVATVSPPTIVGPASGAALTEASPTLTIGNSVVKDGSTPTYTFQVAADSSFANVVAQAQSVSQGGGGQTSWRVNVALADNQYFWRAKATAGGMDGLFSPISDFRVTRSVAAPDPGAGALVYDPLTNGSTVGTRSGGVFTSAGWRVARVSDYIRYDVRPLSSGFVEWQNRGLSRQNPVVNGYMLLGMWDPSRGPYRENAFRVHLQKLDMNHNRPYLRLRFIANVEQHDAGTNLLDWTPSRTYQWRMEWGPDGGSNLVRVLLDGQPVIEERYTRTYGPSTHYIELGIAERAESVVDAVYSNVRIGAR